MVDFSQILRSSVGSKSYQVTDKKDFFSLRIDGTDKRLIRIDCTHTNLRDHSLAFGDLHACVKTLNKEATVFNQKIYLGVNLIIIPPHIQTIESFYLNQFKFYGGSFTVSVYQPATQVVVNPFSNQPVVLGQESLDSINAVQQALSQQIIQQITRELTTNIAQELIEIQNEVNNILSSIRGVI